MCIGDCGTQIPTAAPLLWEHLTGNVPDNDTACGVNYISRASQNVGYLAPFVAGTQVDASRTPVFTVNYTPQSEHSTVDIHVIVQVAAASDATTDQAYVSYKYGMAQINTVFTGTWHEELDLNANVEEYRHLISNVFTHDPQNTNEQQLEFHIQRRTGTRNTETANDVVEVEHYTVRIIDYGDQNAACDVRTVIQTVPAALDGTVIVQEPTEYNFIPGRAGAVTVTDNAGVAQITIHDDQDASEVDLSTGSFNGNLSGSTGNVQQLAQAVDDLNVPIPNPTVTDTSTLTELDRVRIGSTNYQVGGDNYWQATAILNPTAGLYNITVPGRYEQGDLFCFTTASTGQFRDASISVNGGTAGNFYYGDGGRVNISDLANNQAYCVVEITPDAFWLQTDAHGQFDIHDDVTGLAPLPLDPADRFILSTESVTGDPNAYITFGNLQTQVAFDLHDDVTSYVATLNQPDRLLVADVSEPGDPNRYTTVVDLFDSGWESIQDQNTAPTAADRIPIYDASQGGQPIEYVLWSQLPGGGGGGTEVMANPDGVTDANPELDSIRIASVDYRVAFPHRGVYEADRAYRQGDVIETGTGVDAVFWVASDDISIGQGAPTEADFHEWWRMAGHGWYRGVLDAGTDYDVFPGDYYISEGDMWIVLQALTNRSGSELAGEIDGIDRLTNEISVRDEGAAVRPVGNPQGEIDHLDTLDFRGDGVTVEYEASPGIGDGARVIIPGPGTLGADISGNNLDITLGTQNISVTLPDTMVGANPPGTDGADLNRISIAGTNYNLAGGGGTSVVANPAGTGGTELTRIEIDGTDYAIPGIAGSEVVYHAQLTDRVLTATEGTLQHEPAILNRGGFTITNGIITVPEDGLYRIAIQLEAFVSTGSGNGQRAGVATRLTANNATISGTDVAGAYIRNTGPFVRNSIMIEATVNLAANSLVGVQGNGVLQSADVEITLDDIGSTFTIEKVDGVTGEGGGTVVTANPSGTTGPDLTRISIDGTNYNLGGGTEVSANPAGVDGGQLNRISIDGSNWTIPRGSTVVGNPTGADGADLNRIQIDGTNFNIPMPSTGHSTTEVGTFNGGSSSTSRFIDTNITGWNTCASGWLMVNTGAVTPANIEARRAGQWVWIRVADIAGLEAETTADFATTQTVHSIFLQQVRVGTTTVSYYLARDSGNSLLLATNATQVGAYPLTVLCVG